MHLFKFAFSAFLVGAAIAQTAKEGGENGICNSDSNAPKVYSASEQKAGKVSFGHRDYSTAINCYWHMKNDDTTCDGRPAVNLTITALSTEFYYDLLNIYEGDEGVPMGKRIASLSGTTNKPINLVSNSPDFLVSFHSDMDNAGNIYEGFNLTYNFICLPKLPESYDHCKPIYDPMKLNDANGTVIFTGSDTYVNNLECGWLIENKNASCVDPKIQVNFFEFGTELSHDFLTLYNDSITDTEDPSIKSKLISRFTGPYSFDGPGSIRTDGSKLLITFNSDHGISGDTYYGFSMNYKMVCGKQVLENCPAISAPKVISPESPGIISKDLKNFTEYSGSFNFTSLHYKDEVQCGWLFKNTNPDSKCDYPIVKVEFGTFHTEELYDLLTLYDGNTSQYPKIGTWSGSYFSQSPGFQKSTGDSMLMTFQTDRGMDGTYFDGFAFNYTFSCSDGASALAPPSCPAWKFPRVYSQSDSKVEKSLHISEESYNDNLDCVWKFVNDRTDCPAGSSPIVRLEFPSFDVETQHDFLAYFDGSDQWRKATMLNTEGKPANDLAILANKSYSGKSIFEKPTVLLSDTEEAYLYFHSDGTMSGSHGHEGFDVNISYPCSGTAAANSTPAVPPTCTASHLAPFMTVEFPAGKTMGETVSYGHHSVPFTVGYPSFIEQAFQKPSYNAMLYSHMNPVKAEAVFAADDADPSKHFCCGKLNTNNPYTNVNGKIAVCERGGCIFATKVRAAQAAGARGVLVVDYDESGVKMSSTLPSDDITIPAASVKRSMLEMFDKIWTNGEFNPVVSMGAYRCGDMDVPGPDTGAPTILYTYRPTQAPTTTVVTVAPTIKVTKPPTPFVSKSPTQGSSVTLRSQLLVDESPRCISPEESRQSKCLTEEWKLCLYTCCESQILVNEANIKRWYREIREECLSTVGMSKDNLAKQAKGTGVIYFVVDAPLDRITPDMLNTFTNELSRHFGWNPLTVDVPSLKGVTKNGVANAQTELTVRVITDSTAHAKEFIQSAMNQGVTDDLRTTLPIEKMEAPLPEPTCPNLNVEECQKTSIWNVKIEACECSKSLTGLGVLLVVFLPLFLVVFMSYMICLYTPGCYMYKGSEGSELQRSVRKGNYREAISTDDNEFDMGGGSGVMRKGSILAGLASDAEPGQYDSIEMSEKGGRGGAEGEAQDFKDISVNLDDDDDDDVETGEGGGETGHTSSSSTATSQQEGGFVTTV